MQSNSQTYSTEQPFPIRVWMLILWLCLPPALQARQAVVKDIRVSGTEKTKDRLVLNVLTFAPGDTIDLENLQQLIELNTTNVYNLGLFNTVDFTDSLDADSISFEISVKERWYIWPNAYLTFEERTIAEWWRDKDLDRLVYGAGVSWENFSGWNDRLFVYGQLGYSRRVSVSYSRPFLFPKPRIDGLIGFRYVSNKEIGYGTDRGILQLARLTNEPMRTSYEGYAQLGKRFSPRQILYLTLSYHWFHPHDSIVYFNSEYVTNIHNREYYPGITLSYVNDQRDLKTWPMQGYKYSVLMRQNGLPGIGTSMFAKLAIQFSHHIPLSKRWNFAWGLQGNVLFGNRVPYYDKFFIGLDNFIRGYELYVIDGSHTGIARSELKFALIPRRIIHVKQVPFRKFQDFPLGLYLSAFADAGIVHDETFNNNDNYLKDRLLAGYGLGLNFVTIYDRLIRAEFSLNRMGGYGLNLNLTIPIR